MPEDAGERTETPTPRKRLDARERGQVAKSQDLAAAVILLGGLLALDFFGQSIMGGLIGLTKTMLGVTTLDAIQSEATIGFGIVAAKQMFAMLWPLMLLVLLSAILVMYGQIGFLLTGHPLIPSLNKLNPISGIQRMFSFRSVVMLFINVAKLALVGLVGYYAIVGNLPQLLYAAQMDHVLMLGMGARMAFSLAIKLAVVLLLLGILDYVYQRHKHEKDLRMTKEEVKEELRRMEGDPILKRRRREVQMQLAIQRIRSAIPQADVVVTNPTELAIALKYEPETMSAPKVLAKGEGYIAQRMRELAVRARVPIVQRPALVQAMYRIVEVGREVPPQFYKAVAEILAYVYELSGKKTGLKKASVA